MPIRKVKLVQEEVYHIYNKSIAGFNVFNNAGDYNRMIELVSFYIAEKVPCKFSTYKILKNTEFKPSKRLVDIVAYCLMPTHIHFVLKQNQDDGIEKFIGLISQSYGQYFNLRHKRKGPLWEGRFKNVLVNNNDQLLHLTRYVHLNPVTTFLVNNPEDWKYSSYNEYLSYKTHEKGLCSFSNMLKIDPATYKKFVLDHIDYQRQLAIMKEFALDY